jgi:hypothetical protein
MVTSWVEMTEGQLGGYMRTYANHINNCVQRFNPPKKENKMQIMFVCLFIYDVNYDVSYHVV